MTRSIKLALIMLILFVLASCLMPVLVGIGMAELNLKSGAVRCELLESSLKDLGPAKTDKSKTAELCLKDLEISKPQTYVSSIFIAFCFEGIALIALATILTFAFGLYSVARSRRA